MLATASNNRHNNAIQHELEEIVADLPHTTTVVNSGPASISQHATCKIHCSNPDDLSRVLSFKHFQDYVISVTKDGLYFVCDKLELMFPANATRTKVLLGTINAIQLLKENGATIVTESPEGSALKVPLEAMASRFQDPFFACDPPSPIPPIPFASPFSFRPSLSPTATRSLVPSSGSLGSSSGLLVGANVPVKPSLWHSLWHGSGSVWQSLASVGVKPFLTGLVIGFVDEILGAFVPARYQNQLNFIKNLLKSTSSLIGTSVLIYMIVNKETVLATAVFSVLISYVFNLVGGTVGAALAKLLQWVKTNYFTKENTCASGPECQSNDSAPMPKHMNMSFPQSPTSSPLHENVHYCGQENNGFVHIGLCINCNLQPAVFGFVHSKENVAHSAFCLACSSLYRRPTCVCRAEVSSTYYFSTTTPTCNTRTCLAVAQCVTCDERGADAPNTANIWRMRKTEETQTTHKTVTLDVRYCHDHVPVTSQNDQFRYGKLYATGYM